MTRKYFAWKTKKLRTQTTTTRKEGEKTKLRNAFNQVKKIYEEAVNVLSLNLDLPHSYGKQKKNKN